MCVCISLCVCVAQCWCLREGGCRKRVGLQAETSQTTIFEKKKNSLNLKKKKIIDLMPAVRTQKVLAITL